MPGYVSYGASKAALSNLMEGRRLGLHRYGIAVTTICPGFIKTEITKDLRRPLPFLMELAPAVRRIHKAIERKTAVYAFPLPLAAFTEAGQVLPRAACRTRWRRPSSSSRPPAGRRERTEGR